MSDASEAVRGALVVALGGVQASLFSVGDPAGAAPGAVLPRIEVAEPVALDWGAKEMRGRELRTQVTVRVAAGQAGRLGSLRAAAEGAIEGIGGSIDGWRVASVVLLRVRTAQDKAGLAAVIEHRVRVMEEI